ncbi:MAG: helix-turn-helix transcriptional regulator [Marivirga sp.]|nr:helix-turn-helix transcriptional regulator [Marivirga sp.]
MINKVLIKHRHIITYGISLAVLLFLLKWLQLRLMIINHAAELYTGAVALIFTGIGIWLALKLAKPQVKTIIVEKEVSPPADKFEANAESLVILGLSKRELEVLGLMAQGLSNKEIAEHLFISISTVKSHSNSLFEKMNVERRTQAIDKGKKLGVIP